MAGGRVAVFAAELDNRNALGKDPTRIAQCAKRNIDTVFK
jgi:hypothetical protein